MKRVLISANVAAAIGLYILGSIAVAAHKTHALSVYEELKSQHVLNERPDYDVEKRLRTMADGGNYSLWVAEIGGVVCIVNAVAIGFLFTNPNSQPTQKTP